jgi:HD-like signal output (HDOD) protein
MDIRRDKPPYRASAALARVWAAPPPSTPATTSGAGQPAGPLQLNSRTLQTLAPLPETATRLMSLLNDPAVSLQRVAEVASRDVSITASFLRMANSPIFGLRGRIGTVTNAIRVIGIAQARMLVVASGVSKLAQRELAHYGLAAGAFMRHGELVANLTMSIAQDRHYPNIGLAYTAGLLHDIGKVVLNSHAQRQPSTSTIEAYMSTHGSSLVQAEQSLHGATHAEIGQEVAEIWALPEEISAALGLHHTIEPEDSRSFLAGYIRLANQVACQLDGQYPAFHHSMPIAVPDWVNMDKVHEMAAECGFGATEPV